MHCHRNSEIRRAAAKTLKGFCLTYLPHHFPADLSDFFDEMAGALENHNLKRLEMIGFRGCAKSTMASLAPVLWAALEHPDKYPFIIMLADTTAQATINMAAVQHELRDDDLILRDYGRLKYRRIDDPQQLNIAQGQAGENSTEELLGNSVAGTQVTFITSTGARTRIDFVTTIDESFAVVEAKTGNAQLTSGQAQLQADVNAGNPVTPVGQNAAAAGFDVGVPTLLDSFTINRPF